MSFLRPTQSQWRTPEVGKNFVVTAWRGVLRLQRWPKKIGAPRTEREKIRRELFAVYMRLIKRLSEVEQRYERQAIAEYNKRNRGQRGSAAIRFRDWQLQRLYGRGIAVTLGPNLILYPPAVRRDASGLLDHCGQTEGQILQRGIDGWHDNSPGEPGQVLTAGEPGQPNTWTTP